MIVLSAVSDLVWYGPATATFAVQFPGDPYDAARNDVRVTFLGDKAQREERVATFDPVLGAWRATLYTTEPGSYRAVLVRNGKTAIVEAQEGILEVSPAKGLGVVQAKATRPDRLTLDTGEPWVGVGGELGPGATPEAVEALADAGATWVRIVPPADPLADDALSAFDATMDAVARRGLAYTFVLPATSSAAWRRYALARYGTSPRLVQWEAPNDLADPWPRARASTAAPWNALFENAAGPFLVTDHARIRGLRSLIERSEWATWSTPRVWKGAGAKGVGETDRLILVATPGAPLTGLPLADGAYDLTTIDPATGAATTETAEVVGAKLTLRPPAERFFVLRRRL